MHWSSILKLILLICIPANALGSTALPEGEPARVSSTIAEESDPTSFETALRDKPTGVYENAGKLYFVQTVPGGETSSQTMSQNALRGISRLAVEWARDKAAAGTGEPPIGGKLGELMVRMEQTRHFSLVSSLVGRGRTVFERYVDEGGTLVLGFKLADVEVSIIGDIQFNWDAARQRVFKQLVSNNEIPLLAEISLEAGRFDDYVALTLSMEAEKGGEPGIPGAHIDPIRSGFAAIQSYRRSGAYAGLQAYELPESADSGFAKAYAAAVNRFPYSGVSAIHDFIDSRVARVSDKRELEFLESTRSIVELSNAPSAYRTAVEAGDIFIYYGLKSGGFLTIDQKYSTSTCLSFAPAKALYDRGNADQLAAIREGFNAALRECPRYASVWSYLGATYQAMDEPVRALAALRAALVLEPLSSVIRHNLSRVYETLGFGEVAKTALQSANDFGA